MKSNTIIELISIPGQVLIKKKSYAICKIVEGIQKTIAEISFDELDKVSSKLIMNPKLDVELYGVCTALLALRNSDDKEAKKRIAGLILIYLERLKKYV